MNPKTCAITGTTGFVGKYLAAVMTSGGWGVRELNRNSRNRNSRNRGHSVSLSVSTLDPRDFTLGRPVDPAVFKDVDILIHCAYDFSPTSWDMISRINIEGTRLLFDAAQTGGVKRIVLISSIAAFPGCRSMYGKAKLECEKIARDLSAVVIRPGLLYGVESQGVYGRMEHWVKTLPAIPVLSADSKLFLCHIEDLCRFIREMVVLEKSPGMPLVAAHPVPRTLTEIIQHLQTVHHRPRPLIPIGWQLPWLVLRAIEILGLRPPFRSDSIIGLVDQNRNPDFSALAPFQTRFRNIF